MESNDAYSSFKEFESVASCLDFLTPSLRSLLESLITSAGSDTKIAFLGQSLMQQVRPRSLIVPLPIALGVTLHHHFASRFLVDLLSKSGYITSYSEVQRFERNAALAKGSRILDFADTDCFIQFMADNVDHDSRTLDGKNTFHVMGSIASVTPL